MEATAKNISAPCGAIDLGSNSFRLLIGTLDGDKITTLVKKLRTVRLAKGLNQSGSLSSDAVRAGLQALDEFKSLLDSHNVKDISCFGTEALRQATNSQQFIYAAKSVLGCEIKILTGTQEALLSAKGVLAGQHHPVPLPMFTIDVGGGSTEISYIQKEDLLKSLSLPLGAVSLNESDSRTFAKAISLAKKQLGDFLSDIGLPGSRTITATGGTATTLAMLDLNLEYYDEHKVQGHYVETSSLDSIISRLSKLDMDERNLLPGLEHGRGEIIVPGCKIYQEIIATIGVEGMIVSDWGLLEGILLENKRQ